MAATFHALAPNQNRLTCLPSVMEDGANSRRYVLFVATAAPLVAMATTSPASACNDSLNSC